MPSPNIVKNLIPGGVYHVANWGIDGRAVFASEDDFAVFLDLLKDYLTLDDEKPGRRAPVAGGVELIGYCLLPDHFHLVLRQYQATAMTGLMRRLGNAYIRYYNQKYDRRGPLFAGKYRAALVRAEDLPALTRWLHRHPGESAISLADYRYSSYAYYLRYERPGWLQPAVIRDEPMRLKYRRMVEDGGISLDPIRHLLLDPAEKVAV